ncbi:uncharacterized protein GIQ15_03420 [Arthroderma uncinatum]|uniref:uncharacterized protein n=1 Tax=Arthroderma uncinatum TaxID=74035 RepID=UPI00144AE53B|nr:uncharacterized protein GIQ15_03420 [Arthroderma uncinatum]KAF3484096.1 hypothetical protein GIQ15_03420 [Arthroderma uncinatum]
MPRNWERLPLHNKSYPPLLFSYEPRPEGYEVFLTDLAHIWSENLSHKRIINRASKEETSIDPSQDEDQYSVLLQKIGDALHGSKGSSISLSSHEAGSSLKLVTITKLPKPLEPLEWTLNLSQLSPSALTRHILLPALERASNNEDRQYSLFELLKEKDKVIGKLFDKIEASGLDLSTVFPGMANVRPGQKRGSLFSQASKLVKGVNPFDQGSWEDEHSERDTTKSRLNSLGKSLSDNDLFDPRSLEHIENKWWNYSATSGGTQHTDQPTSQRDNERAMEQDMSESEDEFQRQETPPGLKGSEASEAAEKTPKSEATSPKKLEKRHRSPTGLGRNSKKIGSLGKPKPNKKSPQDSYDITTPDISGPPQSPKERPKGLATIGGRKQKISTRELDSDSATSDVEETVNPHPVPDPEDQATASELDDDDDDDDDDEIKGASKPKRQKLPQRGPMDVQEAASDTQSTQSHKPTALRTHDGGIGHIGGKKQKGTLSHKGLGKGTSPVASSGHKTDDASGEEVKSTEQGNFRSKQLQPDLSHGYNEQSTTTTPPQTAKPPKRSGKLGTIGGAKASRKLAKTNLQEESTSNDTALQQPSKDDGGYSNKRGEEQEPAIPSPPSPDSTRRTNEVKEQEPDKDESPEERANRKRQELRRQLELADKGNTKPAKKKRRF